LPQFVKDEFDDFLECGILARGFLRLRCGLGRRPQRALALQSAGRRVPLQRRSRADRHRVTSHALRIWLIRPRSRPEAGKRPIGTVGPLAEGRLRGDVTH